MRYLSVCSGIEAATVAWHPLGWTPVAFSEIEAFPSAVLAHHYPDVPNWGDMTQFKEWPDACVCGELQRDHGGRDSDCHDHGRLPAEPERRRDVPRQSDHGICNECNGAAIDVLVGGTPCQSFSVAGLRKGLDDPRGNLMLTYLAIARRYRPEWLVWENVPGVLSSGGGRDFATFLRGLEECGYGFAYRVLDAQYFGVPQRRRRVFVVGSARGWQRAAAVLFERSSLSGHPAPRREARETVAGAVTQRIDRCGVNSEGGDGHLIPSVAGTIGTTCGDWSRDNIGEAVVAFSENQRAEVVENDVVQALNQQGGKPGQGYPAVRQDMQVRRLTPKECSRLQGFPDDYLDITYRGKPAADGPRYKALGNSMAVPVMAWIGKRIQLVSDL